MSQHWTKYLEEYEYEDDREHVRSRKHKKRKHKTIDFWEPIKNYNNSLMILPGRFYILKSKASIPILLAISSTTCSAPNAAFGAPGARYAADLGLFTTTS